MEPRLTSPRQMRTQTGNYRNQNPPPEIDRNQWREETIEQRIQNQFRHRSPVRNKSNQFINKWL